MGAGRNEDSYTFERQKTENNVRLVCISGQWGRNYTL